jgi:hypothetical protein
MLSIGGLMRQFIGAVAATKAVEIASHTDTVNRIIKHATNNIEQVADLLEQIAEDLEEESDDLSM